MPDFAPGTIAGLLDAGQGGTAACAAAVLEAAACEEAVELIQADAALARACGSDHLLPLLAADLPPELRWREWLRCVEAVPRADLARVVGQGASVDLLIDDFVADGRMLQTRPTYAPAIRVAADADRQALDLREFDIAVLAAIAYEQPITRDELREIFGREICHDLIGRLRARSLIATGPREPRRGAPYTSPSP